MSLTLTTTQKNAIDRDNRQAAGSGYAMSDILADLQTAVSGGAVGIQSLAVDVDSLALGGGQFSRDFDNSSGLTFALGAGRISNGKAVIGIAASTVALTPSVLNYIEVSRAGVVSKNTVGWSASAAPLYTVLAGVNGFVEANVTNAKTLIIVIPSGGITGDMLSQAASTKGAQLYVGSVSATTTIPIAVAPGTAATLSKLSIVCTTAVAQDDANYWSFALVDAGAAGTGAVAMLDATALNSTKITGGSGLVANVARPLTLTATTANLATAASDVLLFTMTKTGTAANLVNLLIRAEFTFTN